MRKYPVARARRALPDTVNEPRDAVPPPASWFSFSYSYTEITVQQGGTRIRRGHTRLEKGNIKSEAFEATLDGGAFDAIARQVQNQMLRQAQLLMNPLLWFFPALKRRSHEDD